MASGGTGTKLLGMPMGLALGFGSLVVSVAIVGLLWKTQIQSMGSEAGALGVSGGVGPNQVLDRTRLTGTISKMQEVGGALESFNAQYGGYPGEVSEARDRPGIPSDSWGAKLSYTPYEFIREIDGIELYREYELVSRGPDGLMDTDDDLVYADGVIVSTGVGLDDDQPESGGRMRDEYAGPGGMVDPGPSSGPGPVGKRALQGARDAAAAAKKRNR